MLFKKENINTGIETFKSLENAMLIDVREESEYKGGHIEESINIPLGKIFEIENIVPDKSTSLFIYCHSGVRSKQATSKIIRMGYSNARNIGGIASYTGKIEK